MRASVQRRLRRCRRVVLGLAFVATLLLCAQGTPLGQRGLAKLAVRLAGGPDRLELEGLGGFFPFSMEAERIRLLDDRGAWLAIEGFRLVPNLHSLAGGTLAFHEVSAQRAVLLRAPDYPAPARPSSTAGFVWPRLRLDCLHIAELELPDAENSGWPALELDIWLPGFPEGHVAARLGAEKTAVLYVEGAAHEDGTRQLVFEGRTALRVESEGILQGGWSGPVGGALDPQLRQIDQLSLALKGPLGELAFAASARFAGEWSAEGGGHIQLTDPRGLLGNLGGQIEQARVDVSFVYGAEGLSARTDFKAQPRSDAPGLVHRLFSPSAVFQSELRIADAAGLELQSVVVSNDLFAARAHGRYAFAEREATLAFVADELPWRARLEGELRAGTDSLRLRVDSSLAPELPESLGMDQVLLRAEALIDDWESVRGDVQAHTTLRGMPLVLASDFTADTDQARLAFRLSGESGPGLDAGIEGVAEWRRDEGQADRYTLHLSAATLRILDHSFQLDAPVRAEWSGGTGFAQVPGIDWGGGRFRADAEWSREGPRIEARLEEMPLGMLAGHPSWMDLGLLNASLALDGGWERPELGLSWKVAGLGLLLAPGEPWLLMDAEGGVRIAEGRLEAEAELPVRGRAEDEPDRYAFAARVSLPVAFALWPPAFGLERDREVQASIQGRFDFALLAPLLQARGQEAGGVLEGEFGIGGTLAHPRCSGGGALRDGQFSYPLAGFTLRGGSAGLALQEGALHLLALRAVDGRGGHLEGEGRLVRDAEAWFAYTLDLKLAQFGLVDTDELSATARGTVSVAGTANGLRVEGDLSLAPLTYLIDRGAVRLPPALDVVEVGGSDQETREEPGEPPRAFPVEVALRLRLPGPFTVVGQNIDSEWSGDLWLTLSGGRPAVQGHLEPRRGKFIVFGRPFQLAPGRIQFAGEEWANPSLDLRATHARRDLTAEIHVTGTLQQPALRLSSVPSYPTEEILSRILFGKSLANITPVQMVRIGLAMRNMANLGGGAGFMSRLQHRLEVDRIDIVESGDEGRSAPEIIAGKHLSDRLYLEYSLSPGGRDRVTAEYELRRGLYLETDAGPRIRPGIGVNYRYDY